MDTDGHEFQTAVFAHPLSEMLLFCKFMVSVSIGVHPWLNCRFEVKKRPSSRRIFKNKKGGHCWPPLNDETISSYGLTSRKYIWADRVFVMNPVVAPTMVV